MMFLKFALDGQSEMNSGLTVCRVIELPKRT